MREKDFKRFSSKVLINLTTECLEWTGAKRNGYGAFWLKNQMMPAHRVAYEHFIGPISAGWEIDHLCKNTSCVSPQHLEAVTPRRNRARQVHYNRDKTECIRGHPFNVVNTYLHPNGGRYCRECMRMHRKKWRGLE